MIESKIIFLILISLLINKNKTDLISNNLGSSLRPLCQCQDFRKNCDLTTVCYKDCTDSPRLISELDCTFPFQYKGVWYDTCTDVDSPGNYWCSITTIYSNKKAQCEEKCPLLARNLVKNVQDNHTSCRQPDSDWRSFYPTESEIQTILTLHNAERSIVSPEASDMKELFWDLSLARLAMNLAATGVFAHDCSNCRRLLNKRTVHNGQNLWISFGLNYNNESTWRSAIMSWINEKQDFEFGIGSINGKVVGHFTQVVSSLAVKIGCGGAINDEKKQIIIACNYAVGQFTLVNPYTLGSPCSNCGNCVNGTLCSCNKLCQNSGVLDLSTCRCNCPVYATGDECEILKCDKTDEEYGCLAIDNPDWCVYSNIKPSCPHMCGLCSL